MYESQKWYLLRFQLYDSHLLHYCFRENPFENLILEYRNEILTAGFRLKLPITLRSGLMCIKVYTMPGLSKLFFSLSQNSGSRQSHFPKISMQQTYGSIGFMLCQHRIDSIHYLKCGTSDYKQF